MSYSYTTGQTGSQTAFSINTGTVGSPVWTVLGQVQEITQSGKEVKTIAATNLQSLVAEVLPTLPDSGTLKCTAIRVPADPGQLAVLTAFNLGAAQPPQQFKIVLAKDAAAGQMTTGDSVIFSGYITECMDFASIAPEKIVPFDFSIKVQSLYAATPGS